MFTYILFVASILHACIYLTDIFDIRQARNTGHRSQVIVLPIQKVSQTLLKANLRPKNVYLGLIRPKVSFYKCLRYFLYW